MALGRKTGGGSRLGRPNRHPKAFRDQLRAYCTSLGIDPFRYMADLIANTDVVCVGVDDQGKRVMAPLVPIAIKFNCAKELASYLEPKQRALTVAGDSDNPIVFSHQIKMSLNEAFARAYSTTQTTQNGFALIPPHPLPGGPVPR